MARTAAADGASSLIAVRGYLVEESAGDCRGVPKASAHVIRRPAVRELTIRAAAFCREYIKDGNGGRSARAAGYKATNAYGTANDLLSNPRVIAELARLKAITAQRHEVTVDQVMRQAARMAFVDPRSYVDASGALIPLHELSDEAAAALQGLEVDQTGNGKLKHRYKLVDRGAALERLMRHLGLFEKDNTQAVDAVGQLLAGIHSAGSRIGVKR